MLRALATVPLALALLAAPADGRVQPPLARIAAGTAAMSRAGRFSGVLVVAKHGKPVLQRAYGLANRETREPNRLGTQFNLASLGKVFTGVAC